MNRDHVIGKHCDTKDHSDFLCAIWLALTFMDAKTQQPQQKKRLNAKSAENNQPCK